MKISIVLLLLIFAFVLVFIVISLFADSSFLMFIPIILPFGWFYKKKVVVKDREKKDRKDKWT